MVADLQHRTSKNGKGFGFLTLEDYDGSYEFKLFGDDYLNYQKYMISGAFLYVKFKVVEGFLNRETNQKRRASHTVYAGNAVTGCNGKPC